MRCEFIAIGTELLLGQIVNSNAAWIGERLALAGIDCHYHVTLGDNRGRMTGAIRQALERSDAVIVSGGLGPTQDDITREAIAEVMGVPLERDEEIAERIRHRFESRGRVMSANNLRQADIPVGGEAIPQMPGTAPGLVCPVGDKVVYAVPGVPFEMRMMVGECVIPDLQRRAGITAVIRSRVLRTWGQTESGLDEMLADRMAHLDEAGHATIAFQASGIEGLKVRLTVKAATEAEALSILDGEEAAVREVIGRYVFGVDDETMERVVLSLLRERGLTLALAESVTGGLVAARLCAAPGSEGVLRAALVQGGDEGPLALAGTSGRERAEVMAGQARHLAGADIGAAAAGDGEGGRVHLALAFGDAVEHQSTHLPGDRDRIREYGVISLLNFLRLRLLGEDADTPFAGRG